ncbi:hypothetical protein GCM10009720_22220 [Yaniella flava]|uniref:Sporulation protein YtfJ n=1 Tax=Yaniella flava TaxID=287930 RepID=A0ABN2URA4_9MICC
MANIAQELAETLSNVGVKPSYGAPIELDGATILPVAVSSFGFGAGEGNPQSNNDNVEGSGGGGGGCSAPVGAYITRDGVTRFEPNTIALLAVGIPFMFVTGRAVARVVKALKS